MSRFSWILRMAWRDGRGSKKRWFLSALCISMGVAAVVAIGSLRATLERGIEEQTKTLVGADFVVEAKSPFAAKDVQLFQNIATARVDETRLTSMALFPTQNRTRLVQLRAVEAGFPFYGKLETTPADRRIVAGGGAIVDERLLVQMGAAVGDKVKLGQETFRIEAALRRAPGDSTAFTGLAPRIYLPLDRLPATQLVRAGSLATYRAYLQLRSGQSPKLIGENLRTQGYDFESVEKKKRDLGKAVEKTASFLSLVGLFSLLLGAVGIAAAISAHVKAKATSLGLLRCLGARGSDAVWIHGVQAIALGLTGAVFGSAIGVVLGQTLPRLAQGWLPFELTAAFSPSAVAQGLLGGLLVTLFVSLPALISLLRVSPLAVLREGSATAGSKWGKGTLISWIVLGTGVGALTFWMAGDWKNGLGFIGGLAVCLGVLWGMAWLLRRLARMTFYERWPYVVRQGIANLDRPQNRTQLLVLAIGFSVFAGVTLWFSQRLLLSQLNLDSKGQPNLILFDIQPDQRAGVSDLLKKIGLTSAEEVPMVPMRLSAVGNRSVKEILLDPKRTIPRWVLNRDFRSSYRDRLFATETLVSGAFTGKWSLDREPIPISIEQSLAEDLKATIGSELTFDVQGLLVKTTVGSIRKVDWRKFRTNFFVIFPSGVLEDAPGTFIHVARAETAAQSASLQNEMVRLYPNVSAVDLESVLVSIRGILDKIALATRFLGLFSQITTVLIIISALLSSQQQRDRESALLQVIGASRRQISAINFSELAALGLFSALSGLLVAVGASALLARFVFEADFHIPWPALGISLAAVLTILFLAAQIIQLTSQRLPPWLRLRENG